MTPPALLTGDHIFPPRAASPSRADRGAALRQRAPFGLAAPLVSSGAAAEPFRAATPGSEAREGALLPVRLPAGPRAFGGSARLAGFFHRRRAAR